MIQIQKQFHLILLQDIENIESQKVDTNENRKKIKDYVSEISQYGQKEMPHLFKLARDYYDIKCKNARKQCFEDSK